MTAVMLVTAPPIADQRVGHRASVDAREVGRNRRHGLAQHSRAKRRVEPEALGVPHGTDIDAEALVDAGIVPEGELGAAAAGVEDDERARCSIRDRPWRPDRPAGLPLRPRSPRPARRCARWMAATTSSPLEAIRRPAVPTAAIARTP